jgi:DNA-binding LytR/AlgR family response regulator
MIRIAIVEDEETSVSILKKHLERFTIKTGCQFTILWFSNGLKFISDYKPNYDIVFMDIKMPHLDGIKTSQKLRELDKNVALIFITNMMQYAIRGYEVNALDFMLKPIKYYDFEMKLNKAMEYVKKHSDETVVIDIGDITKVIQLSEILYIEVLNHKLIYHTENGDYETYGQLKKIEDELKNKNFSRCNNCYLVNLRHIKEVYPSYLVVGQHKIQISRRRKKELMEQLTNYLGSGI